MKTQLIFWMIRLVLSGASVEVFCMCMHVHTCKHLYVSIVYVYKHLYSKHVRTLCWVLSALCSSRSLSRSGFSSLKCSVYYSKPQGLVTGVLKHRIRIKSLSVHLHLTGSAVTSSVTRFTRVKATRFDSSCVSGLGAVDCGSWDHFVTASHWGHLDSCGPFRNRSLLPQP